MKLKSGFIVHSSSNETILVPGGGSEFSGIVKGNATLGEILALLKTDISERELVRAMHSRFEAPEESIARDVKKALAELRDIGALDE